MNVSTAAALIGLRPCIEALLVKSCENPESLAGLNPSDAELRQLLRDISSEEFMSEAGPIKDSLLTDNAVKIYCKTRRLNKKISVNPERPCSKSS